ncbi:protein unc-45 homolog B-like [Temnothorax longispinosus]|uniref:protein unc-45 homolog B-like n=1 Tax=Temnothorax longispinosus TaxID=300112 RepID=UPI003A99BD13
MTAQKWKEKGNEEFNKGIWSEALSDYTNALNLVKNNAERTVYYKNRAAALLKRGIYEEVIKDCNNALKICCNKALYRRCQALEALDRFEEAYQDAEIIISSDPNNKVIQPVKERLHEIVQGCRKDPHLSATISQMLDLAFNVSAEKEKREIAMTSLLMLARDEASAEEIFQKEVVSKIAELITVEENEKVICSAIRIVDENILNTYSGMNNEHDAKPDKTLCETHKNELDMILSCLLNSITNKMITGLATDAIIELITHNIHTALNWAEQLVELRGLQKLLEIASQLEEYESSFDITSSTRTVRIILATTTLIFGPLDVAEAVIFKPEIFEMIFAMSKTDDILQQKVVCECIVAVVTKYKKPPPIYLAANVEDVLRLAGRKLECDVPHHEFQKELVD